MNFAMSQCNAKYVTIAHQDDIYEPAYAEKDHVSVGAGRASVDRFFGIWRVAKWERKLWSSNLINIKRPCYYQCDQRIFRK